MNDQRRNIIGLDHQILADSAPGRLVDDTLFTMGHLCHGLEWRYLVA